MESTIVSKKRPQASVFGKNQLLWDLGMNANSMTNKQLVLKKIQELDKQFDLVLIAEHFDESLVLLDDILCWPQKDLTYLKQNERTPEAKSNMTSRTRTLLKKWLWADYLLYDYFKEKLLKRFQIFPQFEEKLKSFKALNQQIHADCIILKGDNKFLKGKFKMALNIVMGYVIDESKPGCDLYAISEPAFSGLIYDKQRNKSKKN